MALGSADKKGTRMRTRRFLAAGVLPLLFALLLAACGSPAAGPATPARGDATVAPATAAAPATPPPAPTGASANQAPTDTLRWSVEGLSDLTSLDPARPGDAPNNGVITLIYAGLVRLDDKLQVVPDGASDWKVTGDGKIYTFTIR